MKICTIWFQGKTSSTLILFSPAACVFQHSVFIPRSLVSPCSPSPGLSEERVGDQYGNLSALAAGCAWLCVWKYANAWSEIMWRKAKGIDVRQLHLVDSPAGTRVESQIQPSKCWTNCHKIPFLECIIWRFIEMGWRKRRTESAGLTGVNLFFRSIVGLKKKKTSQKEGLSFRAGPPLSCYRFLLWV